jgi:hypothetical protein
MLTVRFAPVSIIDVLGLFGQIFNFFHPSQRRVNSQDGPYGPSRELPEKFKGFCDLEAFKLGKVGRAVGQRRNAL